ncbi:unnamed protein product [Rotaria sp. Silwood1]|nr:unnamed protein product [Rotaria sp. Silwood1]CAF1225375.1 unnamed protein product [Rotaria sp. Silwood1]CAF3489703.1 unnamed protein product [Rotaria sp. Silwood1]CAF3504634.1 unnamed protein product [Rotaria sp. Silwood1]CAF4721041.1 unnamed protein product [Rotaria sp. Silwood1]
MITTILYSNYEYMDKMSINKDLKCDYCNNPFVEPVSTPCNHIFCRVCIENKIKNTDGTCAKPKCKNKSITLENLTPVTKHIILNMLDRLLVKCTSCGMANIERSAFEKHYTKTCPKAIVSCTAIDIKCPWTGPNDQLKQHIFSCIYEQIRPVINEIIQDNRQLKEKLQQMSEQYLKYHQLHIKELQEINQRLNKIVEQLNEILYQEKNQLNELQNEMQQLKELIIHNKTHINELQIETQRKKNEIIHIEEPYVYSYNNSQLENNISKCQSHTTIDLSKHQLLDRDMEIIIKQAIIEKECTRLDLSHNFITSIGTSILADALKHNTTLEELDFHDNRISDIGVQSLTKILSSNTSIIKALGLGSNGITDKGVEYLAEMLKINRTVTWLALAGNQIGDRGVRLLANTLAHQNSTLLVLSLHVNKSISDESINVIIDMLQHNKSLKKLWIYDCNISEYGKMKLREATKSKQNFSLYM